MWGTTFALKLKANPEEVLRRLQSATRPLPRRCWESRFSRSMRNEQFDVEGGVEGNRFEIYCFPRSINGEQESRGNFYLSIGPIGLSISDKQLGIGPVFRGQVEQTEYGSLLHGSFRPSIVSFSFCLLFFAMIFSSIMVNYDLPDWLIILVLLLIGGGVYWLNCLMVRWDTGGQTTIRFLQSMLAHITIRESPSS